MTKGASIFWGLLAAATLTFSSGCGQEKVNFEISRPCIDSSGFFQVQIHNKTDEVLTPTNVFLVLCDKSGNQLIEHDEYGDSPEEVELRPPGTTGYGFFENGTATMGDASKPIKELLRHRPDAALGEISIHMNYGYMKTNYLSSEFAPDVDTPNHEIEVFRSPTFPLAEDLTVTPFSPPPPSSAPNIREVALSQICADYDSNVVHADAIYLRQMFKVSGIVFKVGRDGDGHPFLAIADDLEGSSCVICYLSQSTEFQLKKLEKGQPVTVLGQGARTFESAPLMGECMIVSQ